MKNTIMTKYIYIDGSFEINEDIGFMKIINS